MEQIVLLDLCCKAGGCSMGYYQAANDLDLDIKIVGIDIEPQPNYPFEFIQMDAVEFLSKNHKEFTHIHASPPCQQYSNSTAQQRIMGKVYKDNLSELKTLMYKTNKPGVIENVRQAPIRPDLILHGPMFGLKVLRIRHFELVNWFMLCPPLSPVKGSVKDGDYVSVFGNANLHTGSKRLKGFEKTTIKKSWQHAMGINWMTKDKELSEAIPPAYTRFIGNDFFKTK